jgi:hypothetical protein
LVVKEDIMQVEDWEVGEFFVAAVIRNRLDNWRWRLMTVLSVRNVVPTLTSNKRQGLSLNGRC